MNIGVFGDSFASGGSPNCWFHQLKLFGHEVISYGQPGSSIWYSVFQLLRESDKFDFNILCMTTPQRWSWPQDNDGWVHTGNPMLFDDVNLDAVDREKLQVCRDYVRLLANFDQESFIARCVARQLLLDMKNLMIIPCFRSPLELDFSLFGVCTREVDQHFPNITDHGSILVKYRDIRQCHMTTHNNAVLAALINQDLAPGIFQTDYHNFNYQTTLEECMVKR